MGNLWPHAWACRPLQERAWKRSLLVTATHSQSPLLVAAFVVFGVVMSLRVAGGGLVLSLRHVQ